MWAQPYQPFFPPSPSRSPPEPLVGQVIEPLVYGHSTGLSPIAVVASATFWTALWGPIGLVLATPLTVCLVVLGRHVDRFQFLEIMLSDRPPLSPPELFYQRMLAGDPDEAVEKAEEFLKERPLLAYYDDVALPGLKLAQNDLLRGALEVRQTERIIRAAVLELIDDLSDQEDRRPEAGSTHDAEAVVAVQTTPQQEDNIPVLTRADLARDWQSESPVLCVAGRGLGKMSSQHAHPEPTDDVAHALPALTGNFALPQLKFERHQCSLGYRPREFYFWSFTASRLVKRALPSPVPIVRTPQ